MTMVTLTEMETLVMSMETSMVTLTREKEMVMLMEMAISFQPTMVMAMVTLTTVMTMVI